MGLATIELSTRTLDWSRVYIAGVLNVTPDSFSDGGCHLGLEAAVDRARAMARAGADLIDIGGESTRPGAAAVDAETELGRVIPVIEALRRELDLPLSVDTTKASVARAALDAGAEIINDISGGLFEPAIIDIVAAAGAVYICGHVRGATLADVHAAETTPPSYEEVAFALADRIAALPAMLRHRTIVDPCLGFGKQLAQNLELTRCAGDLGRAVGCPVMIGPSRKRFIRTLAGIVDPSRSMAIDSATVGACLAAAGAGAQLVRVHNVELLKPALMVYEAILGASS